MTLKQINLKTTALQMERSTKTSMPPTEIGAVTLSSSQQKQALDRLLQPENTPYKITSSLERYLEQLVGLDIKFNSNFEKIRYVIPKDIAIDKLETAMTKVLMSLQTFPTIEIEERLKNILLLVSLPTNFDGTVATAKLSAIAKRLSEFPADMVVQSIKLVEENSTFMPAYAEFYKHIKYPYECRKMMYDELHKCIAIKYIT